MFSPKDTFSSALIWVYIQSRFLWETCQRSRGNFFLPLVCETSTLSNYNLSREIFLCYYGSCCLLFSSFFFFCCRKHRSLTMPRSIKSDTAGKLHTSHDSRALMVAVIAQISISFCLLKWMILLAQVTIHRPIILNEQLPVDTFHICDFFFKNPYSSASRTLPFWNTHPLELISP